MNMSDPASAQKRGLEVLEKAGPLYRAGRIQEAAVLYKVCVCMCVCVPIRTNIGLGFIFGG